MTYEPAFQDTDKVFFKISLNWLVLFSITGSCYPRALTQEEGHVSALQSISDKTSWVSSYSPSAAHQAFPAHFACNAKECVHKLLHKQRWEDGNFWQWKATDHWGKSHFPLLAQECFSMNWKSKQTDHYLLCKASWNLAQWGYLRWFCKDWHSGEDLSQRSVVSWQPF